MITIILFLIVWLVERAPSLVEPGEFMGLSDWGLVLATLVIAMVLD